ncbi:MAG: glycosyltransferase [Chitinophagaceae bacterium]|nr:glycosyltransferase [Oligoflexus sp.]
MCPAVCLEVVLIIDQVLVIPCYNEARRFRAECFAKALANVPNLGLLFVNDGSTDRTSQVLNAFVSAHPNRCLSVELPKNQGKAEAVRQGFLKAFNPLELAPGIWSTDALKFIGYWDCDLATPLSELPYFLEVFSMEPDLTLVMGARIKLLGRSITRHSYRHYLGRIFATAASMVLRLPVYDTQCGAKLFKYESGTRALFEKPFISSWIFDVEILARMSQKKAQTHLEMHRWIYELPLREWKDVDGSKVKPTDFLKAILSLFRIARAYPHTKSRGSS